MYSCSSIRSAIVLCLLPFATTTADADTPKDQPVGLVLSAGTSQLLRSDAETPLSARPGDLLFPGDGIRTTASPASFLFCPAKSINTLSPAGEVRVDAKQSKVKTGKISEQPGRACLLPSTLRVASASQQHYGVTMTRGVGKPDVPPTPRDKLPAEVLAELAPYETALAANSKDLAAIVGEATVFESHKLIANALEMYYKLREQWPDTVWVKVKIFELEQTLADQASAAITAATAGGTTYALLVGISKYAKPELNLQYAEADAVTFGKLLQSPRGGNVPTANILLLTDEKATNAAVRNGFEDFLKRRATKRDTVIIVVAGHGTVDGKRAYILTHDSDPQDLQSTALAMADLQALFEEQLAKVGRVLLFVDVCKSGTIGTIKNNTVNASVESFKTLDGELVGMTAGRPKELSQEGPQFGGGHGAFSYFVIKGLEGAADEDNDGAVEGDELIQYVFSQVPKATSGNQHPQDISAGDAKVKLSDIKKPGINLAHWRILLDSRSGAPRYLAAGTPTSEMFEDQSSDDIDRLNAAISSGRILPTDPDNAFTALQKLRPELSPELYTERENQLRITLENKAQEVLLRYLAGEDSPQSRQDFERGSRYMEAARILTKESLYLEGRQDFFQGRALLFDKKFPEAANLLEQSVRIDPAGAYAYNALGISYLEQAQYQKAIPAFRDAARRAQHWAYPLHNEALAFVEIGDYKSAIRAYQEAIRLTPQYSYLPYNLGLVYQRLNRRGDAEAAYKKAMTLAPGSAEPYNALGSLKASEGKRDEAERLYRESLQKNPALLPARHNLAVLLAGTKDRQQEAIDLWRQNLQQQPDYLPSRLSLAETLAQRGDNNAAIEEYRKVLDAKPDYVGARLALADLLVKTNNRDGALEQLRQMVKSGQQNPKVFEQIGDMEAAQQHPTEAKAAYQSALALSPDRATRKRIQAKLQSKP